MTVKQITVKIPNKPGQLSQISEMMGDGGVNILALFVSTNTPEGYGLMRFVADDPEKAVSVVSGQGLEHTTEDVIAAETPHHAGGLQAFLSPLKREGVNVEYLYPCIQTGESTILIFGTSDTQKAIDALKKDWIRLYGPELYDM